MFQSSSMFGISDNSGGKKFKCIKVLGGFKKRYAKAGRVIVGCVQGIKFHKKKKIKIKDGEVIRGLIIRSKRKSKRVNLTEVGFGENSVVLLNKKNQPLATRIMGPVLMELRIGKYMKVASLSEGLV